MLLVLKLPYDKNRKPRRLLATGAGVFRFSRWIIHAYISLPSTLLPSPDILPPKEPLSPHRHGTPPRKIQPIPLPWWPLTTAWPWAPSRPSTKPALRFRTTSASSDTTTQIRQNTPCPRLPPWKSMHPSWPRQRPECCSSHGFRYRTKAPSAPTT